MYLWKTGKLAAELKLGTVSEKEKLKYLFFSTALVLLATSEYLRETTEPTQMDLWFDLLLAALNLGGVYWVFRQNQGGDNRAFLDRFFCLSAPVTVRVFLLTMALGLGPVIWSTSMERHEALVDNAVELFFTGVFYWRLGIWMKKIGSDAYAA